MHHEFNFKTNLTLGIHAFYIRSFTLNHDLLFILIKLFQQTNRDPLQELLGSKAVMISTNARLIGPFYSTQAVQ